MTPPLPELFVAVNLPARDLEAMHAWAMAYGSACAAAERERERIDSGAVAPDTNQGASNMNEEYDPPQRAEAGERNLYYEGPHRAEEPEDAAARVAFIAARDARIAMLEAAIVAMAEDGWLMYGHEDMDAVQQLCYDAYLTIKQPKEQGA